MATEPSNQAADGGAEKFTKIEVNAFYNDDNGPESLHQVKLDGLVNLTFEDDEDMETFFRWLSDKFKTQVEIELIKQTWELQHESYSPR